MGGWPCGSPPRRASVSGWLVSTVSPVSSACPNRVFRLRNSMPESICSANTRLDASSQEMSVIACDLRYGCPCGSYSTSPTKP